MGWLKDKATTVLKKIVITLLIDSVLYNGVKPL